MNNISELISIIMPCYNASKTIEMAITSVVDQSYINWELFVIDDASTDQTPAILSSLQERDKRIQVLHNTTKSGVAFSRNRGISQAQGKYIAFLDADDFWYPDKLAMQVRFMNDHGASISCTAYGFIDIRNKIVGHAIYPPESVSFKRLVRSNALCCPTVMVCADIMKRHPFLNSVFHEDYVVWLEIVRETGVAFGMPQILTLYRIGCSSKSSNKWKSAAGVFDIYRRHLGYNFFSCCRLMCFYAFYGTTKYFKRFSFCIKKQLDVHRESVNEYEKKDTSTIQRTDL